MVTGKGKVFYIIAIMILLVGCSQVEQDTSPLTPPIIVENGTPETPAVSELDFEITPVDFVYTWVYRSQPKKVDVTLFTEEFHYLSEQKRPELLDNSFAISFINEPWQEDVIQEIVSDLKSYGDDDDETLRMALQFVRSIPFNRTVERWTYPYETLYLGQGVCADKTFLAAAIAEELGYKVAIMGYNEADHMILGIGCQEEYRYWEEYCFVDVTSYHHYVTDDDSAYGPYAVVLPDYPDYAWEVSNGTKEFDANGDYLMEQEVNSYIETERELNIWLEDKLQILTDAKAELDDYKFEIENTEYSSREEWEFYVDDYNDFLNDYKLGVADYNDKLSQYNYAVEMIQAYKSAYGLD